MTAATLSSSNDNREMLTLSRTFTIFDDYDEFNRIVKKWLNDHVAHCVAGHIDQQSGLDLYRELSGQNDFPASIDCLFGKDDIWKLLRVYDFKMAGPVMTYTYEVIVHVEWSPAALQLKLAHF